MMRAARDAADDEAADAVAPAPLVDRGDDADQPRRTRALREIGCRGRHAADQVERLAALARRPASTASSPRRRRSRIIRRRCGPSFAIVTPGIRGADDAKGDQQRTLSAARGARRRRELSRRRPADHRRADPRAAAERIAAECRTSRVIALTIYSRPGCHLCDEMKALVDARHRTTRTRGTARGDRHRDRPRARSAATASRFRCCW